MMHRVVSSVIGWLLLVPILSGCGNDRLSSNFTTPAVTSVVSATTPTGLIASGRGASRVCDLTNNNSCFTKEHFLAYVQNYIFKRETTGALPASSFYRYWAEQVDDAMASTNSRLGKVGNVPCLTQTPVDVNFSFNVSNASLTETAKLQCWERHAATITGASQNLGFGTDGTNTWLVLRRQKLGTAEHDGSQIVIAKVSVDGTRAEMWMLGRSYEVTFAGPVGITYRVQRLVVDGTAGTFTFNSVEDTDRPVVFSSFYANADPTNTYVEARATQSGVLFNVTFVAPGTGWCGASSNVINAGTDCTSIVAPPSNFGLTHSFHNATYRPWMVAINEATFPGEMDAIEAIDFSALGVAEFSTSVP